MTQVGNEISTLRSNPRFFGIMFAIGAYPTGGVPGSKSPQWIAPIARLIAVVPDSEDRTAQTIAARTIAIRAPGFTAE
jgi:hypothetical protein